MRASLEAWVNALRQHRSSESLPESAMFDRSDS
jgi:hypothetical protein